jgi:hypothetical protein
MTLNLFWVCRAIDTGFWMVGPPFSDIILLEANMSADTNQSSQNLLGTFARLYWMLFGNLAMLFTGFVIARSGNALYPSILYFLILISVISARYADVKFLNGQLADVSGPATINDWKKYSISISLLSFAGLAGVTVFKKFIS